MGNRDVRDEKVQAKVLTRLDEHARRAGKTINDLLNDMLDERECKISKNAQRTRSVVEGADEWTHALRSWAASHRLGAVRADDSREGIYEGRGE